MKKEVSKKTENGQTIEGYIKNLLYVPDDIVIEVLKDHLATLEDGKDILIEGFPKTIYQSMAMQRTGILADMFLLVNHSQEQMENFVVKKFEDD